MFINPNKFSKKSYFMELALNQAKISLGNTKKNPAVGCVLVKKNRIIAQGYNGFLPGCPHISQVRDGHEQATVHAEQNAIADCAKRGASCEECTAYITHYPCLNCMKILCAAGIKEIKYIDDYKNDDIVTNISSIANVKIAKLS